MIHKSTKTYGHDIGLSAAFRQPFATHSHCRFIHGYSLAFKFVFACHELDDKNWVVDFGGLKPLKEWLVSTFDHKVLLDENDPHLHNFRQMEVFGVMELTVCKHGIGVEKFACYAFDYASNLIKEKEGGRCWVESVECSEHGANSAIYTILEYKL